MLLGFRMVLHMTLISILTSCAPFCWKILVYQLCLVFPLCSLRSCYND